MQEDGVEAQDELGSGGMGMLVPALDLSIRIENEGNEEQRDDTQHAQGGDDACQVGVLAAAHGSKEGQQSCNIGRD